MTFWLVVGVIVVTLLSVMWRMDRRARRRGGRVVAPGEIGRKTGLTGRASPYAQGTFDHHGAGPMG